MATSAASRAAAGAAPLAELEAAAAALVRWSESRHIRDEVTRRARSPLAPSSLRLLEHFDVAGPMRVKDMAECLEIDISTASLQLRDLKRLELVTREKDPHDGRAGVITITEKGRRLLGRVRSARCHLLGEVFGDIPDEQILQAARTLQLVQQRMLEGMAEAGYIISS
jgi:DNA-binding MarR family transcriptional regulator